MTLLSSRNKKYVIVLLCLIVAILFHLQINCAEPVKPSDSAKTINGKTEGQLHQEGLRFFNEKQYEKAIKVWLKEFELDSKNANTANNIGIAHKEMGDYDAAIEYHKKSLELNPNFGHTYYSIGLAYFFKRNDEQAIESFTKAIKLKYKIGLSYYNLGLVYRRLQNYENAVEAYSKAIANGYHHNGECFYELGLSYFMLGQFDQCMEAMNKAEKVNPNIEGIHYFKGVYYKKKGFCLIALYEFDKARKYKDRYFKENTDFEARTMFSIPEKAGCRDIDAMNYFFTGLIPIGYLFFMRKRNPFLKLDGKKAVTFGIIMLLVPMPLYMVVLMGTIPSIHVLSMGVDMSLRLEGYAKIIGFLVTLLHYVVSITLNYLIVCSLYHGIKGKKAFWVINGALLLIALFVPTQWLADVGGGRHIGGSYFEYLKRLIIGK
jgi:tetratricopeptide (TPR) repeat protein